MADNDQWSMFSNTDILKALVIAIPILVGAVFAAWQLVRLLWQGSKFTVAVAREVMKKEDPPLPEARIHKDREVR